MRSVSRRKLKAHSSPLPQLHRLHQSGLTPLQGVPVSSFKPTNAKAAYVKEGCFDSEVAEQKNIAVLQEGVA